MAKQTFTVGQVLTAAEMTSLQQTAMGGGSTTAKTASYTLVAADAGTVVQMNSASATTITVNTALFAAGDTVQIQNVGAGVCTVTAGTATVSTAGSLALSQYEGGQLYFNTTSAALFFDIVQTSGMTNPLTTTGDIIYSSSGTTAARLAIGSANQALGVSGGIPAYQASSKSTLTTTGDIIYASAANTPARLGIGTTGQNLTVASGVPSWATPAASGGLTLIATATPSAATTVSFTSIPTTYKVLLVKFVARQSTTTDRFTVQVNAQTGSIYNYTAATITGTNTTVTNGSTGTSSFGNSNTAGVIPFCSTSDDSDQAMGEFYIYDADVAQARHQISWQSSGGATRTLVAGQGYVDLPSAIAISQIDFIRGGSQTITGTFYLYGWS